MDINTETNMSINIELTSDNKLYCSYDDIHNLIYDLSLKN